MIGGSLVAGGYGMAHDQVTYSLSAEYFSKLKFEQFAYARMGLPDRGFVAVIGFLASWWVGMIAGWIYGRVSVVGPRPPLPKAIVWRAFGLLMVSTLLGGVLGYLYGTATYRTAPGRWQEWGWYYGVQDLAEFARVGQIHLFGYVGGLLGLLVGSRRLRNLRKSLRLPDGTQPEEGF